MFLIVITGDKVKTSGMHDIRKFGKRGSIFDRNNTLIATDLKNKSLYVSSILVKDPQSIAKGLTSIFPDISTQDILRKIADGKNNKSWILIRRNLTPNHADQVQNLQISNPLLRKNDPPPIHRNQ